MKEKSGWPRAQDKHSKAKSPPLPPNSHSQRGRAVSETQVSGSPVVKVTATHHECHGIPLSRSLLAQGFICSLNAKIQIKANAFGLTNYLYFSMNVFVTSILILLRKKDRRHKNTLVSFGRMRAEKRSPKR